MLFPAIIFVSLIYTTISSDADDYVTFYSTIKLQNNIDDVRVHSHEVKYGSGSGQQSVTATAAGDDVNSHWQILGSNNTPYERGRPIKCDETIRMMHLQTRCFLHSHDFPAPITRNFQEVSCFGKEGEASDTGDHFKVVCSGDGWHQDDKIAFQHIDTGKYLALSGQQFGRPISGQREVVATSSNDYSSYWIAAEGIYIKAPAPATIYDTNKSEL